MPPVDLDYEELIRTLSDNFTILANEVQSLSDRNTILVYKLRFAHEQYQHLADKYAPGDAEISSILAKLQLSPSLQNPSPDRAAFVPLPQRQQTNSKVQTAVAVRDGRKAAQRLALLIGNATGSTVSGRSISGTSSMRHSARKTSLSTVLEQDFTVPGKKSSLLCPYAPMANKDKPITEPHASQGSVTLHSDQPLTSPDMKDPTPHQSSDPICAAMYAETMASPPPSANGSAAKCPIRFLDQHSPEEVAKYFETHKHEIPRSHEVCVKRYQRNENDIRKLDAKYGNLVSMIQGLGQKHQPMLPSNEGQEAVDEERGSNERVESWANAVSTDGIGHEEDPPMVAEEDRESRFDRPMKEIRVGESPSRPWGISVPILEPPEGQRPVSPPPAPVSDEHLPKPAGKCPFGHGQGEQDHEIPNPHQEVPANKFSAPNPPHTREAPEQQIPPYQQPDPAYNQIPNFGYQQSQPQQHQPNPPCSRQQQNTGFQHQQQQQQQPAPNYNAQQPTFLPPQPLPEHSRTNYAPMMIFNGPVFIGYSGEQAMAFMQQWQDRQ